MKCPQCQGDRWVKNGRTHYGKQRLKCKDCGRRFVEGSQYQHISQEIKDLIDRLLLERMSLAAIARVTDVSIRWLQNYVNQKYRACSATSECYPKKERKNNDSTR